jgi:hypothetical protein
MRYLINGFLLCCIGAFLAGCCKDKKDLCVGNSVSVNPFVERFYIFWCNNNDAEYTYTFTKSEQIDSLQPDCFFTAPIAFPIDESSMRYFILGRISYHVKDTFQTTLLKDSCSKKLVYEVNMIQRDTAYYFADQRGGVLSMFCSVENIPPDYQVEVKYKYVPLE